ncbi:MAG: tRNA (N6-isopentenyl adenosine(37)-C2)-methylthiotransferase MiaB [Rhabdochlamydiaceae bacterium]
MRQLSKFFLRTYGCQMNELDSEIMVGLLEKRGLARTDVEDEADLLIFNTCSIRDLAERKVMGKIGKLGTKNKRALIGVTGCMAMTKKETLFKKLPNIDFIIGTNNISELNTVLDEVLETGRSTIRTDDQFEENLDYLVAKRDDPLKAFVSIIRGCDKFCTYCVVPYTRGQEVSRPPESIEEECRRLVNQGYKEITLLGQNVNSYGKDKPEWSCKFHDLLYRLDKIPGLARIRFMTSHPVDITLELMQAIRDLPSVCEFVHFPLQAGSNRILKKMHRVYTVEQYLEKVALLREIVPDVSLGTDIIVGFPTETEEEFEQTYNYFKEIGYSVAFLFAYSARKGTPAFRWKDDIPEEIKNDRLQRLLTLYDEIAMEEKKKMLGSTVEVLVESRQEVHLKGRTRCWKKVIFSGSDSLIGTLQQVTITGYSHQTLLGYTASGSNGSIKFF